MKTSRQAYNSGEINYMTVVNSTVNSIRDEPYSYYVNAQYEIVSAIDCVIGGDQIVSVN